MTLHDQFDGTKESLPKSRDFIQRALANLGWQEREIDIQLAIGEVMQNIIRYGFDGGSSDGRIGIHLELIDGELHCRINDTGRPSNPETWLGNAEKRRPVDGGYGLSIIHALTRVYEVEPQDAGNTSHLVFPAQKDI